MTLPGLPYLKNTKQKISDRHISLLKEKNNFRLEANLVYDIFLHVTNTRNVLYVCNISRYYLSHILQYSFWQSLHPIFSPSLFKNYPWSTSTSWPEMPAQKWHNHLKRWCMCSSWLCSKMPDTDQPLRQPHSLWLATNLQSLQSDHWGEKSRFKKKKKCMPFY